VTIAKDYSAKLYVGLFFSCILPTINKEINV